uniref:Constitutive coactivator of PPAR-gamma-like protein 1 n=1 Tax=Plectus sambesii TaxID=2011161 RepID=A0A914UT71_9BILA
MAAEGVDKFLEYVKEVFPDTCTSQDLLKLSRRPAAPPHHYPDCTTGKACVLIDGECCLDRLYGGYYSDWACGGQWNRVLDFLPLLASSARNHNVSLVVVFDGSLNHDRDAEWKRLEADCAERSKQIMQHIRRRHTPPPKSLWIPPTGLRSFLRLALMQIGITVFQTVDDHKQEVMTFLRDNHFDVLLAEGAEYLFMDPPRFMFASSLKLTFKGRLDVREIALDDVCRKFDLHPNRLALVAALLGNFLVSQKDLKPLHDELMVLAPADQKTNYRSLVPAIVTFVRNLPSVDDVKTIGEFIFAKLPEKERAEKTERFVRSVNYYLNATKESFHKFKQHNSIMRTATGTQKKFASDVSSDAKAKNLPEDVNALESCLDGVHIEDPTPTSNGAAAGEAAERRSSADSSRSASPVTNDPLSDAVTAAQTAASAPCPPAAEHTVPVVAQQIVKIVMHRHCKAQMHPWIHQALTKPRPATGHIRPPPPLSSSAPIRPHQVSLMHPRGSMNMGNLPRNRMPLGPPPPPPHPPMSTVYRPVPPMVPAPPYGSFPMMTRNQMPSMDALQQYQANVGGRPVQGMPQQVQQRSRGGSAGANRGGGHSPRSAPSMNVSGGRFHQQNHAPNRQVDQHVVRQTRLTAAPMMTTRLTTRLTTTVPTHPSAVGFWNK